VYVKLFVLILGLTNIVTMLNEDEQVETSIAPPTALENMFHPLDMSPGKPLFENLKECVQTLHRSTIDLGGRNSVFQNSLCKFAVLVLKSTPQFKWITSQCFEKGNRSQTAANDTKVLSVSSSEISSSSDTVKSFATSESKTVPTLVEKMSMSDNGKDITSQSSDSVIIPVFETKTSEIKATHVEKDTMQHTTTVLSTLCTQTGSSVEIKSQTASSSEPVHINPTPTSVHLDTNLNIDEKLVPTPSLPSSWAPEVIDVQEGPASSTHSETTGNVVRCSTCLLQIQNYYGTALFLEIKCIGGGLNVFLHIWAIA